VGDEACCRRAFWRPTALRAVHIEFRGTRDTAAIHDHRSTHIIVNLHLGPLSRNGVESTYIAGVFAVLIATQERITT